MKPVCEVAVKVLLPGVRALLARELVFSYGLSQQDVAGKLGLTQPAVSQYLRSIRGCFASKLCQSEEIVDIINTIAWEASRGSSDISLLNKEFCRICKIARVSGMLCSRHRSVCYGIEDCEMCRE